ncbi:unnamed protein product [Prorocentrum cordatum]|uniref:Uncharacterized protein n=1 Tax=Prorocentrum cordatum TaxID=2364126 RepID=A0ABN9V8J8_9DINO|nr:unnamed protein product [Polarella glacialis]
MYFIFSLCISCFLLLLPTSLAMNGNMNPFAPRPLAPFGNQQFGGQQFGGQQFPGFGRGYSMGYPPMQSATMPPSIRPAPMRVYESQVIDLRQDLEGENGRFLLLHMDDTSRFEVVSIATSYPGLKETMKKEKARPIFVKANEDWSKSLQRAEDIAQLIPMSASDDQWGKFLIGVRAVHEQRNLPIAESVGDFLYRKRAEDEARRARLRQHPGTSSVPRPHGSGLAWRLLDGGVDAEMVDAGEQQDDRILPKDYLGMRYARTRESETLGRVFAIECVGGEPQFKIHWDDDLQTPHDLREISSMSFPEAPERFNVAMPSPNPRPRRRARDNECDRVAAASASAEWDRILPERPSGALS